MTSEQRHEMRYQRRKKLRQEKLTKKAIECGAYEKVFSYENLYTAGKKCIRGVIWKASIQNYTRKRVSNTYKLYEEMQNKNLSLHRHMCFGLTKEEKLEKYKHKK